MSYPDPPTTSDAHYTPIYPATPNPNATPNAPLHDTQGPPRAPYAQEPPYTKIENLDVLQAHALHANHALNDQRVPAQHALPPLAQPPTLQLQQHQHQQQQQQQQQQKPNRLRKACDSCSIRKVKVCSLWSLWSLGHCGSPRRAVLTRHSATRRARHVEPVFPSRSPAPLTVPVAAADRPTGTPKTSKSGA